MGLFDVFKKKEAAVPENIEVKAAENTVFAPTDGKVIALTDVADPVFSSGALGEGLGILAESDGVHTIYAPVSGKISATTSTLHAIGLTSKDGVEVLIHVGIDTVEMQGDGFTSFVKEAQEVVAGQALMTFDIDKIKAKGYDPTVIMAITNSSDFKEVKPVAATSVHAGEAALSYAK